MPAAAIMFSETNDNIGFALMFAFFSAGVIIFKFMSLILWLNLAYKYYLFILVCCVRIEIRLDIFPIQYPFTELLAPLMKMKLINNSLSRNQSCYFLLFIYTPETRFNLKQAIAERNFKINYYFNHLLKNFSQILVM